MELMPSYLLSAVIGVVGFLLSRVVWDWLKSGRALKIEDQRVRNIDCFPVTHAKLREHCKLTQETCVNSLMPQLQLLINEVKNQSATASAIMDEKINEHKRFLAEGSKEFATLRDAVTSLNVKLQTVGTEVSTLDSKLKEINGRIHGYTSQK